MTPHHWLDFKSAKRIALFVVVALAIVMFWSMMPDELKERATRRTALGRARIFTLPACMFVGWLGGWFLLLFVRVEDLQVRAPFNYQALYRVVGVGLVCCSLAIASYFAASALM